MPVLPSGLELLLDISEIMEPDINWFKAPEGHFWYWRPADENPPPFTATDEYLRQPQTAPVPESRDEMTNFVRVIIKEAEGSYFWEGDYLAEFPFFRSLSTEDLDAWKKWLGRSQLNDFLDRAIEKCKTQAEINKDAYGYAVVSNSTEADDGQISGEKVIQNPLKGSH